MADRIPVGQPVEDGEDFRITTTAAQGGQQFSVITGEEIVPIAQPSLGGGGAAVVATTDDELETATQGLLEDLVEASNIQSFNNPEEVNGFYYQNIDKTYPLFQLLKFNTDFITPEYLTEQRNLAINSLESGDVFQIYLHSDEYIIYYNELEPRYRQMNVNQQEIFFNSTFVEYFTNPRSIYTDILVLANTYPLAFLEEIIINELNGELIIKDIIHRERQDIYLKMYQILNADYDDIIYGKKEKKSFIERFKSLRKLFAFLRK
jgi:hypothetical protein